MGSVKMILQSASYLICTTTLCIHADSQLPATLDLHISSFQAQVYFFEFLVFFLQLLDMLGLLRILPAHTPARNPQKLLLDQMSLILLFITRWRERRSKIQSIALHADLSLSSGRPVSEITSQTSICALTTYSIADPNQIRIQI